MRSQPFLITGFLTLRIRGASETRRELTDWSNRGTLVLGSSFWSFSSRVLSGTPKSLFSTTETTCYKSVSPLIQMSRLYPMLQTKRAHFINVGTEETERNS